MFKFIFQFNIWGKTQMWIFSWLTFVYTVENFLYFNFWIWNAFKARKNYVMELSEVVITWSCFTGMKFQPVQPWTAIMIEQGTTSVQRTYAQKKCLK